MSALREELERLAEQAPAVHVPGDTWARARADERRARVVRSAVVAAVVVLLAGVLASGLGVLRVPGPPDPAGSVGSPAVPDRLWRVPDRMSAVDDGGAWLRDEVTADLAVGQAAVAWVTTDGLPVVVDALDGDYHLLDLPDFLGEDRQARVWSTDVGLALSPDGGSLAFAYAAVGPESVTEPVPSGVRVVDLETGVVDEWPVPGPDGVEGTVVTHLAWSRDGRWLAFRGEHVDTWTPSSIGGSSEVLGRLAPRDRTGSGVSVLLASPAGLDAGDGGVGVTDGGAVLVAAGGRLLRWDGRPSSRAVRVGAEGEPSAGLAPASSSDLVALGRWGRTVLTIADTRTGRARDRQVAQPTGEREVEGQVEPLGWVDGERVLVLWRTTVAEPQGGLALVEVGGDVRQVAEADIGSGARSLTVAVDLVDPERPTAPRPEPDFPWAPEQWAGVAAGALVVVGLLALGVAHARRRRRDGQRSGTNR